MKTRTTEEITTTRYNFKALKAICNGIDQNQFWFISKFGSAKDASEILQTTYEDTELV